MKMKLGALQRGFTLIELMIVVAVIAILASIAYPAYTDSILKGRRAEARSAVMELMQQQERYMTQRGTYLAFTNVNGVTTPSDAATTFKTFSGDNSTSDGVPALCCCMPDSYGHHCSRLRSR